MVTEQLVTDFFQFKVGLRSTDLDEITKKKRYLNLLEDLFPQSVDKTLHHSKLDSTIKKMVDHFDHRNSKSIVWIGGSYTKGKINSIHTDLDFYIVLPHLKNEDERLQELQIIKDLADIGFIISEFISPFSELIPVIENGEGLARLSGFTLDGVELDFHFIGIKDAGKLHFSQSIKRVRSVSPYAEWRVSFDGEKQLIVKPSSVVLNRFNYKGKEIKGFYLDNFSALGDLIYDPRGIGRIISDNIWFSIILGYIKNNDHISFDGFLNTLYYQDINDYSNEKLAELKHKYTEKLCQLN